MFVLLMVLLLYTLPSDAAYMAAHWFWLHFTPEKLLVFEKKHQSLANSKLLNKKRVFV